MKTRKTTRRALVMSILALLMCVSMLVGTTFAWFTDTATTAVNKIQAGTLDIALMMKDGNGEWVSAEGQTLNWQKAAGHTAESVLWEPGCTYILPELKIVNNGNLALKYRAEISGILGDAKLLEAIDFTVAGAPLANFNASLAPGESGTPFTITGHMKEAAGNEYQGLSIDGIGITVYATQLTSEYDSFDNTYDAGAPWTGGSDDAGLTENTDATNKIIEIATAEQLASFANSVNAGTSYAGYTVKLTDNIDLNNIAWTPINYNKNDGMVIDGNGKTVYNLNVAGSKYVGLFGSVTGADIQNLKVVNARLSGVAYIGTIVGSIYGEVTDCSVSNVTINATGSFNGTVYEDGAKAGGIVGLLREEAGEKVINCSASNVTINGYRDLGGIAGCIYSVNTVTGNTVSGIVFNQGDYTDYESGNYTTLGAIYGRVVANGTGNIQDNTGDAAIHAMTIVQKGATAAETKTNVTTAITNAQSGAVVVLPETEDVIDISSTNLSAQNVTVKGTEGTVVKVSTGSNEPSVTAEGITFENVDFDFGNQTYNSIRGTVTFKNCTFNGLVNSYDDSTYINCTFNNSEDGAYLAHVYGGSATYTGCTFNGSNRCVYVYTEGGNASATFTNCTFTMSAATPDKSAVMLNKDDHGGNGVLTLTITNCTQTGGNALGTASADGANYDYRGLYGMKLNPLCTVTVDGTVVHKNPAD